MLLNLSDPTHVNPLGLRPKKFNLDLTRRLDHMRCGTISPGVVLAVDGTRSIRRQNSTDRACLKQQAVPAVVFFLCLTLPTSGLVPSI